MKGENDDVFDQDEPRKACDDQKIILDIPRAGASQKNCIVCRKDRTKLKIKLKRLSKEAILKAYIKWNIFFPFSSRSCSVHFDENGFIKEEEIYKVKIMQKNVNINSKNMNTLFSMMSQKVREKHHLAPFANLESLTNENCLKITGKTYYITIII